MSPAAKRKAAGEDEEVNDPGSRAVGTAGTTSTAKKAAKTVASSPHSGKAVAAKVPETGSRSTAAADADSRKPVRAKKAVDYNEDAVVKVQDKAGGQAGSGAAPAAKQTAKSSHYHAPRDPPGMKSTAYLVKDPPGKPPDAHVLDKKMPLPSRNASNQFVFPDHPNFTPNQSPSEVMKAGAFGGTYFRKIHSAVTGQSYEDQHLEYPAEWFEGLPVSAIKSKRYSASVNKWRVECGGALDMWESSGWITSIDPYGWFQWYCRFFLGRRSSDDVRQISRWAGVASNKGRFRNQLINKVLATAARKHDDALVSPVIRQTLHHWAYVLTAKDLADAAAKK